jgi:thiamine pyrophosphate-dependent acetolactate synthase large subunit-like protein
MALLHRRKVVARLLSPRGDDLLVVAGLGAPAWDITSAGDHPLNFPMWGGMGGALAVGLGLALAQPGKRILVITGDGELLMGLNSLATVGVSQPTNLAIVALDNEVYGETGKQKTHTGFGVDLSAVAASCGFQNSSIITSYSEIDNFTQQLGNDGLMFAQVKVDAESDQLVLPPRDGALLKNRFRESLLGSSCHFAN